MKLLYSKEHSVWSTHAEGYLPIFISRTDLEMMDVDIDDGDGKSVIATFFRKRYPKHLHLFMYFMLNHRVVFLIDGVSPRTEAIWDAELLEHGHTTIFAASFCDIISLSIKEKCQILELQPLSINEQKNMVYAQVNDVGQAEGLQRCLNRRKISRHITGSPFMFTLFISLYKGDVSSGKVLITEKADLYERVMQHAMLCADGDGNETLEHLQKIALKSHQREQALTWFTWDEAQLWCPDGWSNISKLKLSAVLQQRKGKPEYRFVYESYQAYLTCREYCSRLAQTAFSHAADELDELFPNQASHIFALPKHHLMLELLASKMKLDGNLQKCSNLIFTNERFRNASAETLSRSFKRHSTVCHIRRPLSHSGAQTLAPYLRRNTMLTKLDLAEAELGPAGIKILIEAMRTSPSIKSLDVSSNELKAKGGIAIAEKLAR